MDRGVDILRAHWGASCDRLAARLDGLTDDEWRWEPVSDCWNVHPTEDAPGGWRVDYPEVHPDPAPVTTIAWRMLHISDGNSIYWEHAFGRGQRQFTDLLPKGSAAEAIAYLHDSQAPISAALASLDDEALDEMVPTQFGSTWPTRRVAAVLIDEQVHHGAEIGLLRDLYRASQGGRRWRPV